MPDGTNDRLRVLSEVSQAFASVVSDLPTLLATIARTTAEYIGDGCIVTLIEGDGETMYNAANAHRDPALQADYKACLDGFGMSKTTSGSVSATVARTGQPRMAEVSPAEMVERADEPLKPLVTRLNVHGYAVVPIRAHGRILGTLSLVRSGPGRSYTTDDLLLIQDLADRAGMALETARLYRELRLAVQARDEFLSIASHELRTPLTPLELQLATSLELLERHRAGEALPLDKLEERIRGAAKQVERLTLLINNLLDVTRITSGRYPVLPKQVDLRASVHTVVRRMTGLIRDSGSRLTVDAAVPVGGTWDPGGVESVISNLLSNAVKYGQGKPIHVEVAAEETLARLSVADQGKGIAPSDTTRIFERAVPGKHYGGFGMGLWVCRQIVQAHRGRIDVASAQGAGSTFTVELPR